MKSTPKQKKRMREYYLKNKTSILKRIKNNYDPEKKKEYNEKYFNENKEEIRKSGRMYYRKNKNLLRIKTKKYKKNNREKYRLYNKKFRENNPEKILAQRKLNKAIQRGIIKREPCGKCKKKNSQGHHFDYTKPLEVIWLCPVHHSEVHHALA
jgi:hypothetical protein